MNVFTKLCLGTAAMATIYPNLASASDVIPEERQAEDTIIVRGQRQPGIAGGQLSRGATLGIFGDRNILDTPVSAKSFTEAYIADQIALTSNDIATRDASFSITNATSLNGAGAGRLRGFRMEPFESSFDGFTTITQRRYPLEIIERVDILKGPTSVFTGIVGGVGGTINYVSKKPLDAPLTALTALYSGRSQFGLQGDVSRRFGEGAQFGIRTNLAWRKGGTAIDDIDEESRIAHVAANWRNDAISLDLQYGNFYSLTKGGNGGYFYNAGVPIGPAPKADKVSGPAWDRRLYKDEYIRATLDAKLFAGWSAFVVTGLTHQYERFVALTAAVTGADGTSDSFVFAQEGGVDWGDGYNIDTGVRGRFSTGPISHRVTLSYSYLRSKPRYSDLGIDPNYVQPTFNIYNPASYEGTTPGLTGTNNFYPLLDSKTQGAVFADEVSVFDGRLLVTVGARYTTLATDSYNYAAPSPDGPIDSYKAHNWSPAFAALLKITSSVSLYGNYLKAIESGSTAPLEAVNRGALIPPGASRQYEGGVKVDFGKFGATAAVFDIVRPSAYIDLTTLIYGLYGKERHRGVELDVFGMPVPGVRLLASYAYLDATLQQNADPTLNGNRPVSVPKHVLVTGVDLDVPGVSGLSVMGNIRYNSSQFYDATNSRSIPGFTVYDIGARYNLNSFGFPLIARLAIGNLFNKNYFQSTDFTAQPGAPRTIRLTLSTKL